MAKKKRIETSENQRLDAELWKGAYSTIEAAARLGVHPKTLERLVHRGQAPFKPMFIGRILRWPRKPIEDFLKGDG